MIQELIERLEVCPPGHAGWQEFENICIEILSYAFVPPLESPRVQARTISGMDRRDAAFPNRNRGSGNLWGQLFQELNARIVLADFKNYDSEEIGKDEVDQLRNYMSKPMGKLALLVCNKAPSQPAYKRRNQVFDQEEKVILFLTANELKELLFIKERGEDPAGLIMDLVEAFYLEHE